MAIVNLFGVYASYRWTRKSGNFSSRHLLIALSKRFRRSIISKSLSKAATLTKKWVPKCDRSRNVINCSIFGFFVQENSLDRLRDKVNKLRGEVNQESKSCDSLELENERMEKQLLERISVERLEHLMGKSLEGLLAHEKNVTSRPTT